MNFYFDDNFVSYRVFFSGNKKKIWFSKCNLATKKEKGSLESDKKDVISFALNYTQVTDPESYEKIFCTHPTVCKFIGDVCAPKLTKKLSRCVTYAGKKLVQVWLELPLVDPAWIQKRSSQVQFYVRRPEERDRVHSLFKKYPFRVVLGSDKVLENVLNVFCVASKLKKLPKSLIGIFHLLQKYVGNLEVEDPEAARIQEKIQRNRKNAQLFCEKRGGKLVVSKESFLCCESKRKCTVHRVKKMTKRECFYSTPELAVYSNLHHQYLEEYNDRKKGVFNYLMPQIPFDQIWRLRNLLAEEDIFVTWAKVCSDEKWSRPGRINSNTFRLINVFHPDVKDCLPNDVVGNQRILTGYNQSGKSTLLRTIGLCAYLHQIGCYVPARNALIPLYKSVQMEFPRNYNDNASTFTEHIIAISSMLKDQRMGGSRHFFLIDELCNATNTYEGKEMAEIILKELRLSDYFISTHFTNLGPEEQRVHMNEFRLLKGECKGSLALEYCHQIGLFGPCPSKGEAGVVV